MAQSPPPPVSMHGYEPPECLWRLVELHAQPHEHHEIKRILGESDVEQSLELHEEVNALLEIWRDFRDETSKPLQTFLPEPPEARERLKQQIKFLVENLQEKAKNHGRDPHTVLESHNKKVIEYALNEKRPDTRGSRPATGQSWRDGRDTPLRRSTPNSDGLSLTSSLSEEVESMNEKLNILKLDEVVEQLREALQSEVEQLVEDIAFLQGCLEEEAEFKDESSFDTEPSLKDLKEERGSLERHLLAKEEKVPEALQEKSPRNRMIGALPPGGSGRKLRLAQPLGTPPRAGPLKASHQINSLASPPAEPANSSSTKSPASRQFVPVKNLPTGPSHITIRTGPIPPNSKIVPVGTINPEHLTREDSGLLHHSPSPPTSAKPARPNSASRFRKMVLQCRDTP